MSMRKEVLAVVTVLLTGIAAMRPLPDLMVEKEDSGNEVQSNAIPNILTNSMDMLRDGGCVMEIQYTKRINGKCTKLGKGVEGCVAGSYVHPFYTDCFFAR
uniref:Uncharacterized protein n=1 Tax=Lygus hesperus TaxID=30085 RepID=A0A0A9WM13_LYGHE